MKYFLSPLSGSSYTNEPESLLTIIIYLKPLLLSKNILAGLISPWNRFLMWMSAKYFIDYKKASSIIRSSTFVFYKSLYNSLDPKKWQIELNF